MDKQDEALLTEYGFPEVEVPDLTQEIKDWFSEGQYDVDLMLRMGVATSEQILDLWHRREEADGN